MENLKEKISTILFLYNDPITLNKIKEFLNIEIDNKQLKNEIDNLKLELEKLGLTIIEKENKDEDKTEISISTKKEMSEIVKKIREDELSSELTPASLQVLTICAYLDNPTKNDISFIRGVQSSQSIRSLSSRGLLKKEGEKYSLSIEAMQNLGINKLEDLPDYENIKNDFKERLKEVLEEE